MYNILYTLVISFIFFEFFLWMTNKYCRNSSIHDLDIGADSVILKILCEAILIDGNYSRKQVERYFACYSSDSEWIEKRTNRLLNAKRIDIQ